MREVAATLEPVQTGRRECHLGTCSLARRQQVVLAAPAYGDEAGGRCRTLLQRPVCQLTQHRIEHRCGRQALQLLYDKLRWQRPRTGRQLGQQQRTGDGVARQAGMDGSQQPHQAYRCRERPVEPAGFPSTPEAAGIKRHAVPAVPRRARSSTSRPPTELPTRSAVVRPCDCTKPARASAWVSMVCRPASGADLPCPGRSTKISSRESCNAGKSGSQVRRLDPSPWTISSGRPVPRRSKCRAMTALSFQRFGARTSGADGRCRPRPRHPAG